MACLPLFAYIWLVFMVNVGKYTIHGWYWYPCHLPLLQSASRYAERFPLQVIAAFMAGYHADLEAMDQLGACHFRRFLNMWNLRGYETRNKHCLAAIDKNHQTETLIFCPYFPQLIEISAVVLLRIHSLIQHLQLHGGIMKLWHCMPKRNFPQLYFFDFVDSLAQDFWT